jgi:hypothetical protein
VSTRTLNPLRDDGVLPAASSNNVRIPGSEVIPRPRNEEWVMFVDHMTRGLSFPLYPFVRGLLYTYGLQLHDFMHNSVMQMTVFMLLCECFLGIHPH